MLTALPGILSGTPQEYTLDRPTFTTANTPGLFSLTRLKAGYSNSVCRIRANTTLAEANVNLAGDMVTLNSEVIVVLKGSSTFNVFDRVPLSTFLGTQSAVCVALYDQSGNARFLDSKSGAASYPVFATNGVIENINGVPSVKGNGSSHIYGSLGARNSSILSVVFVAKRNDAAGFARLVSGTNGLNQDYVSGAFNSNYANVSNQISIGSSTSYGVKPFSMGESAVFSIVHNGSTQFLRKNFDSAVSAPYTSAFNFDNFGVLGSNAASDYSISNIGDIIVINAAIPDTDLQLLCRELGAKYNIPVA